MAAKVDVTQAYNDVHNPESEITWAVVECEDSVFTVTATGTKHILFMDAFKDDKSTFGFIRVTSDGAEPSSKFVLVTWVGSKVPPLGRAKMIFDRSALAPVVTKYDDEVTTKKLADLDPEALRERAFRPPAAPTS